MISLENNKIKATFKIKGAELQSLESKITGLNYLWKGDPEFWGKHSPILFPIVGALKSNQYAYEGNRYELSRHGFARDMEFKAKQISETEALFSLRDTEKTLSIYPFKFSLGIRYTLQQHSLICSYEVSNPESDTTSTNLLFSIGGHPAFAVPLIESEKYDNYYLEFNNDDTLCYHKIQNDLIAHETANIELEDKKLSLKHELFYNDALVFKSLKSNKISIRSKGNSHGLNFRFDNFPFFGIWAAKDADFVCLEPWCGIADGVDHDQELSNKEGIISLPAGQSWNRTWEVELF